MTAQRKCRACETDNPPGARFCNGCGQPIDEEQPACVETEEKPDPLVGQLVADRYRVIEPLGEGGMGMVYLAEQISIRRKVALKVLRPRLVGDPALQERFRNEAMLASRLNHPCTVTIFDFGVTPDEALYIAMEFVQGTSLDAEMKRHRRLDWKRACRIATQICESLDEAHQHQIIHRDLKPENIMLTRHGARQDVVKVLDFGIAKILADDALGPKRNLTAPNEIFGTPEYMSPEQVSASDLDARTDIYSLGVILFRMIAGRLPFTADTPVMVLAKQLAEPPPVFREVAGDVDVPGEIVDLIYRMLSKSPADRPQAMTEVSAQLDELCVRSELPQDAAASTGAGLKKITPSPEEISKEPAVGQAAPPLEAAVVEVAAPPAPQEIQGHTAGIEVELDLNIDESMDFGGEMVDEEVRTLAIKRRDATIKRLLERMKRQGDFPAISGHISELNTKAALETTSAQELSNVILKDYALTSKLLKLINSPFYGQVRGRINTISRAVVMMGFEAVQQSALGMMLFERIQTEKPEHAAALRDSAIASLTSAIVARSAVEKLPQGIPVSSEEAFISGMFHQLGKHLALCYFPEEMKRYSELLTKGHESDRAALRVFGITFDDLASELSTRWNFPENLRHSMVPVTEDHPRRPREKHEWLRQISAFSNELVEAARCEDSSKREAALRRLERKYGDVLDMKEDGLIELLEGSVEKLDDYSVIMNVDTTASPVLRSLRFACGIEKGALEKTVEERIFQNMESDTDSSRFKAAEVRHAEELAEKGRIFDIGVKDLSESLDGRNNLNELMLMVIETMYRGLGLSRVIFALNVAQKQVVQARSGFGRDIDRILPNFQFRLGKGRDLFTRAMMQGRDVVVADSTDPRIRSELPSWYKQHIDAPMFLLYPVRLKQFPAALFYGDFTETDVQVDKTLLEKMQKLRAQAAQAIQISSRR